MIWAKEMSAMEWVTPELVDLNSRDALRRGSAYGDCISPGSGEAGDCYSAGNIADATCDITGNSATAFCSTGNSADF
jgi:hypothetical protein